MPTFLVTDPQTGRKLRLTGDSPPTQLELQEIFGGLQDGGISGVGGAGVADIQPSANGDGSDLAGEIPRGRADERTERGQIEQTLTENVGEQTILDTIGRQLGLTVRAGAEGLTSIPALGAELVRQGLIQIPGVTEALPGLAVPSTQVVPQLLTQAGVPQPETPIEQVVGGVSQALTGTGAVIGAGRQIAGAAPAVSEFLTAQPAAQALAATTGAASGEVAREAGAGPTGQFVASVLGSFAAPGLTKTAEFSKKLTTPSAKKLLRDAAPTVEGLKSASREIYQEIDDLGAVLKPARTNALSAQLTKEIQRQGFNRRIHPKVSAALDEFEQIAGTEQQLTNIDTLRRVAQSAANSIEPDEARLGTIMINKIDDFLDQVKPDDFAKTPGVNVGAQYKDARQLWSRARKSEVLDEAFRKASLQASGFENGLRTQFRSILNNKKRLKMFSAEEISAMEAVVKGGTAENIAKRLGKFGFGEGQATSMLLGSLGVAGGAAVGGPGGAVLVPAIGQVSKGLAQRLTRNNAEMANAVVRAGRNGTEVVRAYVKNTSPNERNSAQLTELLLRNNIDFKTFKSALKKLPEGQKILASSAVFLAESIEKQQAEFPISETIEEQ
jgi:hypothetical protein